MGQAKLRAREIAQLKAQGPRPRPTKLTANTHVTAFGAFYHDDQPDGIGVFLDEAHEPSPGWTNYTFHILKGLVQQEVNQASATAEARAAAIELAWSNLRETTEMYNRQVFGTATRRMTELSFQTTLTDTLIETFVNAITNIWFLECMGEIPNDDFNGMTIQGHA